jgi:hypothetical protein
MSTSKPILKEVGELLPAVYAGVQHYMNARRRAASTPQKIAA